MLHTLPLQPVTQGNLSATNQYLREWLQSSLLAPLPLDELAHECHIYKEALVRTFKQDTGLTPGSYLNIIRIDYTCQRLRAGDEIADVGYQDGFVDQSHFHHTFIRYTAATSRQYALGRSISDSSQHRVRRTVTSDSFSEVAMSLLSALFLFVFPALALAHFAVLLSPGPGLFLLVGYAARRRMRGNTRLYVGIASGDGLYTLLAIIGWGILRQLPLLSMAIELSGALYLLWIGSLLVRSRPQMSVGADTQFICSRSDKQLLLGLGSSLLNPKNALFYLVLMTALPSPSMTLLQQTISGVWMTSVVLYWDLLIVVFIGLSQTQRRLSRGILWVEHIADGVLVIFGCAIALRFLRNIVV